MKVIEAKHIHIFSHSLIGYWKKFELEIISCAMTAPYGLTLILLSFLKTKMTRIVAFWGILQANINVCEEWLPVAEEI